MIGIIGVLAAIVLAVVAKSRRAASGVACAANLRQVHAVLVVYAASNKQFVPVGNRSGFKQFNSMVHEQADGQALQDGELSVGLFRRGIGGRGGDRERARHRRGRIF